MAVFACIECYFPGLVGLLGLGGSAAHDRSLRVVVGQAGSIFGDLADRPIVVILSEVHTIDVARIDCRIGIGVVDVLDGLYLLRLG